MTSTNSYEEFTLRNKARIGILRRGKQFTIFDLTELDYPVTYAIIQALPHWNAERRTFVKQFHIFYPETVGLSSPGHHENYLDAVTEVVENMLDECSAPHGEYGLEFHSAIGFSKEIALR